MKFIVLCAVVASVQSTRLSLPSLGWLSAGGSSEYLNSVSTENFSDEVRCVDGVCSIEGKPNAKLDTKDHVSLHEKVLSDWASADGVTAKSHESSPGSADNVQTLANMGWSDAEAKDALDKFQNDITKAAQYLEAQDDELDARQKSLRGLVDSGWDQNAAYFILEKCEGNATAAAEMLHQEENRTQSNFNLAVKDMIGNGWSESVAREALLAQWNRDQRKALGENVTESAEELQKIYPSLRRSNTTAHTIPTNTAATPAAESTAKPKPSKPASGTAPAPPIPAKKEDVVFDVTAANFQKLVLESPVPVLLDVYADWCGPCKQLGPVLEQAAIKAGGMFRLAKVNSDQERAVAEALQVTGLPTVYTVKQGKLNDKFVGMLPQEQLQQYLVRAVTGFGERVQGKDVTDADLADTTSAVRLLAGMASIDFKKKEKLNTLVAQALQLHGAFTEAGNAVLSEGVKTALLYISNCQQDVGNAKFRSINTTSKAFTERILPSPAALRLLDIAGFKALSKPAQGTNDTEAAADSQQLSLVHSNAALLNLVVQRVNEVVNDRRFSRMKASSQDMPSRASRSYRRPASTTTATAAPATPVATASPVTTSAARTSNAADNNVNAETKAGGGASRAGRDKASVDVAMRFTSASSAAGAKPRTLRQPKSTILRHAIEALVASAPLHAGEDASAKAKVDFSAVEVTFPLPRRRLSRRAPELDMSLEALTAATSSTSVSLTYLLDETASTSSSSRKTSIFSRLKAGGSKSKSGMRAGTGKAHTLFSTGILAQNKQKNNEYFGGDSTVVSAGDDGEGDGDGEDSELTKVKGAGSGSSDGSDALSTKK